MTDWILCSECLPGTKVKHGLCKISEPVLVYNGEYNVAVLERYRDGITMWSSMPFGNYLNDVTHWALITAPAEVE